MKIIAIFALVNVLACGQEENYSEAAFDVIILRRSTLPKYITMPNIGFLILTMKMLWLQCALR